MVEEILGLLGFGAFGFLFLTAFLVSIIEIVGKLYATYDSLVREDLTGEQRIIYLAAIWFIPFAWIIYLLLGRDRTSDLFNEVRFL